MFFIFYVLLFFKKFEQKDCESPTTCSTQLTDEADLVLVIRLSRNNVVAVW